MTGHKSSLSILVLHPSLNTRPIMLLILGLVLLMAVEVSRFCTLPDQQLSALWPRSAFYDQGLGGF